MRLVFLLALSATAASAQQPMGTIPTADAQLTGALAVAGPNATLLSNASITALDHTATVTLARGGQALVCATSQFHLLHAGTGPALLFGLDRGAFELRGATQPADTILTPDLRIAVEHAGILDLRLRVTPQGDTCIDNHGPGAPVLVVNASFSTASYRLLPGQHVLFEHGDVRTVIDHETSNCGCPGAPKGASPLAFPEAASAGLTTTPEAPLTPPAGSVVIAATPHEPPPLPIAPEADNTQTKPHGFFHSIGAFFKRLFSPSNATPDSGQ